MNFKHREALLQRLADQLGLFELFDKPLCDISCTFLIKKDETILEKKRCTLPFALQCLANDTTYSMPIMFYDSNDLILGFFD